MIVRRTTGIQGARWRRTLRTPPPPGGLRIAITGGPVNVPPTYFVVQHALALAERHRFVLFAPTAKIQRAIPIDAFAPVRLTGKQPDDAEALQEARFAVAEALEEYAPDVIHQHFATWSLAAGAVVERRSTPMVTTLHGYDVFAFRQQSPGIWGEITRRNLATTVESSRRFIAVSEWLAGQAVDVGIDADRVDVVYQGVDTTFYTPQAWNDTGLPTVVYAGGMVAHKGLEDALEASVRVARSAPHRLRVIGAGGLAGIARTYASEYPHIEYVGALTREQLKREYARARVALVPSRATPTWSEAAGLVALEAQASGVPVIAARSGGLPEMLLDGETGSIVPPENVDVLASALRAWLTIRDEEYVAHRAAAARFVRSERDSTAAASRVEQIYRSLAGTGG